jgi:fructokinase
LNLDEGSEKYGEIVNTPKVEWIRYNPVAGIKSFLNIECEMKINVDVGAAAYFEFKFSGYGAKRNLSFITVGTGCGIGSVVNG